MSATPRTDAAEAEYQRWIDYTLKYRNHSADEINEQAPPEADPFLIARTLEKELAEPVLRGCSLVSGSGAIFKQGSEMAAVQEAMDRQHHRLLRQGEEIERLRTQCEACGRALMAANLRIAAVLQHLAAGKFWQGVYPNGWTAEDVESEMRDYHVVLDGLAGFIEHVTGGKASKPNTDKAILRALHDDFVDEQIAKYTKEMEEELEVARKAQVSILFAGEEPVTVYRGRVHSGDLIGWKIVNFEVCSALLDKIRKLQRELVATQKQVEFFKSRCVAGFYEDPTPTFKQGAPEHEMQEYVTAEEVTGYVSRIGELHALIAGAIPQNQPLAIEIALDEGSRSAISSLSQHAAVCRPAADSQTVKAVHHCVFCRDTLSISEGEDERGVLITHMELCPSHPYALLLARLKEAEGRLFDLQQPSLEEMVSQEVVVSKLQRDERFDQLREWLKGETGTNFLIATSNGEWAVIHDSKVHRGTDLLGLLLLIKDERDA